MKLKETFTVILFSPLGLESPEPHFTYPGVSRMKATGDKVVFFNADGREVTSNFKYLIVQEVEKDEEAKA